MLAMLSIAMLPLACTGSGSAAPLPATQLVVGTWGTDGAGVIVSDTLVHVHVGCTKGDFRRPDALDADGRFDVAGSYMIRAYPIAIGPTLPARFTGAVRGSVLTISIAVNDTVQKTQVALGPESVVLGRQPNLGPCPICVTPAVTRQPRATITAPTDSVPPPALQSSASPSHPAAD